MQRHQITTSPDAQTVGHIQNLMKQLQDEKAKATTNEAELKVFRKIFGNLEDILKGNQEPKKEVKKDEPKTGSPYI